MTNSRRDVLAKLTGTKQVHRLHKTEGSKQKAEALKSHHCSCLLSCVICGPASFLSGDSKRASQCILNELCVTADLEMFHHRVLVERNGSRRDIQHERDLFH